MSGRMIVEQIVFREVWAFGQLQAVFRDLFSRKKSTYRQCSTPCMTLLPPSFFPLPFFTPDI